MDPRSRSMLYFGALALLTDHARIHGDLRPSKPSTRFRGIDANKRAKNKSRRQAIRRARKG